MTENFKIIGSFIKDMSSETPDAQTFIFVRDKISKYRLNIDINSKAVKNGIIEVNTILKFTDQPEILKKSHLPLGFWAISILGAILIITYSIFREDPVLFFSHIAGIIIYSRNIYFIYINKKKQWVF